MMVSRILWIRKAIMAELQTVPILISPLIAQEKELVLH